jgi:hypothetical protein
VKYIRIEIIAFMAQFKSTEESLEEIAGGR